MERAPGHQKVVGGVLKNVREPVLAIIGEQTDKSISSDWVFTHAGLMPGDYPLTTGFTVSIPQALCSSEHRVVRGVTLEVKHGEEAER